MYGLFEPPERSMVTVEPATVEYPAVGGSESPAAADSALSNNFTYAIFNQSVWIFGPTEDTIILPLLLVILAVLAFSGNLLVSVSILAIRRMRSGSNLMLVNMAACDLVFTGVAIPTAIINHASPGGWVPPPSETMCKFVHYVIFVTAYVAIYTLVVSCVFRFFNEYMAAKTNTLLSRGNAIISCVVIWLAFMISHLNFLVQPDAAIFQEPFICVHSGAVLDQTKMRTLWVTFLTCAFLLPLLIVCALSGYIMHRQQLRRCQCRRQRPSSSDEHELHAQQQCLHMQHSSSSSRPGSPAPAPAPRPPCSHRTYNDAAARIELRKKREMSVVIMAVMILRTICWLPIQCFVMVDVFGDTDITELYRKAEMLGVCCTFVGSCICPLVYNCASHEFRVAYQEVFEAIGCKCGDEKAEDDYSDMNETIMSIISDSSNHINYA
jgi:hypothetical protein